MGNRNSSPKNKVLQVEQKPQDRWQGRMDDDFGVFVRTLLAEEKASAEFFGQYLQPPNYSGMNFCFGAVKVLKRMIEKSYSVDAKKIAFSSKQSKNGKNYWNHMALKLPEEEGGLIIDPTWKQFFLVSDESHIVNKEQIKKPNIYVGPEDEWKQLVFHAKGSDVMAADPSVIEED